MTTLAATARKNHTPHSLMASRAACAGSGTAATSASAVTTEMRAMERWLGRQGERIGNPSARQQEPSNDRRYLIVRREPIGRPRLTMSSHGGCRPPETTKAGSRPPPYRPGTGGQSTRNGLKVLYI